MCIHSTDTDCKPLRPINLDGKLSISIACKTQNPPISHPDTSLSSPHPPPSPDLNDDQTHSRAPRIVDGRREFLVVRHTRSDGWEADLTHLRRDVEFWERRADRKEE